MRYARERVDGTMEPTKTTKSRAKATVSDASATDDARPTLAVQSVGLGVKLVRPAYEQVAQQLRDLMVSGQLVPGERLPAEADLAALFGVGRTTIREGLRLLTSQQLLVTTRGVKGGTFVVTPESDNISRYLETSIGLLAGTERMSVAELLEARECLELPAVRLAARRHGEADIEHLAATVATESSTPAVGMSHSNFHVAILKASGNRMLEVMARPIFDVMRTRLDRGAAPRDFWARVEADHQTVLSALRDRDADSAAEAMQAHLEHLSGVYTAIDVAQQDGAKPKAGRKPRGPS